MVEIDVLEIKNDMARSGVIESAIGFAPKPEAQWWFDGIMAELEARA